jgi:tetratricopeptide (TPR) repeat protein
MAFVEGTDLAKVIDRTGPLPIDRALRFTRQLCGALDAAHEEGVVHRDLKPQNVLVDGADNLFVSDFGLAKSLEAEISMGTRTGQILGTPRYMSPEQVEARDVDHRSDLYSAGLIFYEMFTGELPFRGESAMQLMYQRVSELPRDPRRARGDLPDYLANIILKCLEKDPAKRYQSAREILADLDAQNAPPVSNEGGKTISIQLRGPTRRAGLRALVAMAVVVGTLSAIPQTRQKIRSMIFGAPPVSGPVIERYMAVLPLTVASGDLEYIAAGVEDALTAKLGGLRSTYVADPKLVSDAAAVEQDEAKLAKALGVTILIRGRLQASEDRVSVTIRAEDVVKRQTLLNQEFGGSRKDLLTLEDQIFNAVASKLSIRQSTEEQARATIRPTTDVTAYDLYLRGHSLLRGKLTPAASREALGHFKEAIKVDGAFALAWAGIADASLQLFGDLKDEAYAQEALSAAEQAQRLNDKLPAVHMALGAVYGATGRQAEAIAQLKQARDLAPTSDEALRRLGIAYRKAGQMDEAAKAFESATKINPYYWGNYNHLGGAHMRLGRNEQALAAFTKVTELNPDDARGWGNRGVAYYNLGRWQEAIPVLEKAAKMNPFYYGQLGTAYFFLGRYGDAAQAYETAFEKNQKDPNAALSLADAYRWSNQAEKAAPMYDRASTLALAQLRTSPDNAEAHSVLAMCLAQKGSQTEALQHIVQARKLDAKTNSLMYREAQVYATGRRWAEALASLKRAIDNGYPVHEAQADPELRELRSRPEFAGVVQPATK